MATVIYHLGAGGIDNRSGARTISQTQRIFAQKGMDIWSDARDGLSSWPGSTGDTFSNLIMST